SGGHEPVPGAGEDRAESGSQGGSDQADERGIWKRDVYAILRSVPWSRRKGKRSGSERDEGAADGFDATGQETRRKISGQQRGRSAEVRERPGRTWLCGYAVVGSVVSVTG